MLDLVGFTCKRLNLKMNSFIVLHLILFDEHTRIIRESTRQSLQSKRSMDYGVIGVVCVTKSFTFYSRRSSWKLNLHGLR